MRVLIAVLAFATTTTLAHAEVRNFFSPEVKGARVDACLSDGACGKPAADAFCKAEGYDHAMIFQRENAASTRIIDSGQACSDGSCTAFRQVKCFTSKSDLASLQ
ncbi:hypothetical protein [Aestuariivirga sp.]|uniref:hypothetical protein n=1 Tax=Aestuariivirga sp. TaxID=2650926 RepID=UPI003594261F